MMLVTTTYLNPERVNAVLQQANVAILLGLSSIMLEMKIGPLIAPILVQRQNRDVLDVVGMISQPGEKP